MYSRNSLWHFLIKFQILRITIFVPNANYGGCMLNKQILLVVVVVVASLLVTLMLVGS